MPLILVIGGLLSFFFSGRVSLSLCVPCSFALHFAFCCFRTGRSRGLFTSLLVALGWDISVLLVLLHQRFSLTLNGHTCFALLALSQGSILRHFLSSPVVFVCLFLTTPGNLRDLCSRPGIEPQPVAVKALSPNHWPSIPGFYNSPGWLLKTAPLFSSRWSYSSSLWVPPLSIDLFYFLNSAAGQSSRSLLCSGAHTRSQPQICGSWSWPKWEKNLKKSVYMYN